MSGGWFETVAEAQRRAKRRLPPAVYSALVAGAEAGQSTDDNTTAFRQIALVPRLLGPAPTADMSTTVMGLHASMPVLISPTGVQAVHPDGEVALARAAAARGIPMGLSSFASKPIEAVAAVHDQVMFQMYWMGTRDDMELWMERARVAGAKALIVTLDWSFSHGRDWGSPTIPERVNLRAAIDFAPQALRRPRWLTAFLRARALPDLTAPNVTPRGGTAPTFFGAYGTWMQTPRPTWEDLAWLRDTWGGPLMVKGVWHPDDARRAVDIGAAAISVSNHGGNNLDGIPSPLRVLPRIRDVVGTQLDIVMDGGVRRGNDVIKALALGADAVMIGRASLWGLAANGQAGVENVIDILRSGMEAALRGMGKVAPKDVHRDDVMLPDDFLRIPASEG
jgi:pre-mycofactocin synthase